MTSYTRIRSNYRKFRVYNKYSHPLSLLFIDALILSLKAVAVICLAWFLYKLGSGLIGNSRMGAPAALQLSAVGSQHDSSTQPVVPKVGLQAPVTESAVQLKSQPMLPVTAEREKSMVPEPGWQLSAEDLDRSALLSRESIALKQSTLKQLNLKPSTLKSTARDSLPNLLNTEGPDRPQGNSGNEQSTETNAALGVISDIPDGLSNSIALESVQNQSAVSEPVANEVGGNATTNKPAKNKAVAGEAGQTTASSSGNFAPEEESFAVIDIAPLEGEVWIHNQQPSSYTVQYGTSTSLSLIEEFRAQFPEGVRTILFEFINTNSDEQAVYGVVHGIYGTVAEAQAGIEQMPREVRDYKPWVRRMDQIQGVVYKAQ